MNKQRKVLRFDNENALKPVLEENKKKPDTEKSRNLKYFALAGELGYAISLPIVLGAFLGRVLDSKFDSSPKFTLSLIFLGLFLGFFYIFKIIKESK